ncbi:MAG: A24 family peptidase [Planctomycetes bacterium]|nr:A24 family peptidase [Planctomycetota bacterium]MBU4399347.1 A24 family peptidase [Planctomycetota bacterium]MCG2683249.1 A24 family peptidase [Planctomycetales bacterium]
MPQFNQLPEFLAHNWPFWLLSAVLVLAAVIDGWKQKVPNWVTFPLVIGGWVYSTVYFGWEGLVASLLGTVVGLALLLPVYAIGGMGAGDVKLLAGVGAWVGGTDTLYAFCVSAIVGGAIAVGMVLWKRDWYYHLNQFWNITGEILEIRDPNALSAIAAERKSAMLLLPYGIPIAIGSIAYFYWAGMLL